MIEPASDPAAWCLRLGALLADTGDGVGALAGRVARDWSDAEGVLRADRLTMVHRSLLRTADDAAALGARMERAQAAVAPAGDLAALLAKLAAIGAVLGGSALGGSAPGGSAPGGHTARRGGVMLGDVDGSRAEAQPGMQLPDTDGSR